jgi:hypothetical protein
MTLAFLLLATHLAVTLAFCRFGAPARTAWLWPAVLVPAVPLGLLMLARFVDWAVFESWRRKSERKADK